MGLPSFIDMGGLWSNPKVRPRRPTTNTQLQKINGKVRDDFKAYCKKKNVIYKDAVEYLFRRVIKNGKRLPIERYVGGNAIFHARDMNKAVFCLFKGYCVSRDYYMREALEVLMLLAVEKEWPIEDTGFAGSLRDHFAK